jgi:2-polyprenyl-3-methyl-5-hydroxy-6-metoxy-1,4-benzoquinol methylase
MPEREKERVTNEGAAERGEGRPVGYPEAPANDPPGENPRARWDARYRTGAGATDPSSFLLSLEHVLPRSGRALDIAAGRGRHAVWLAGRGLDVTAVDVSEVGLGLAREAAAAAGVRIRTLAADLEREPLPAGPWDLAVCFHYLHRPLLGRVPEALEPGGLFVFCQPTVRNLERHDRPGRRFLLEEGELPHLVSELEVLRYEEGWLEEGRHEARLFARRPV